MKVLFRVAAGPRIGYGHLRRAVSLARALGVRPVVSLRGTTGARRIARRLGCLVIADGVAATAIPRHRPALLVVDDPAARHGRPWVRAAAAAGVRSASIADAGIGHVDADTTIDGSVAAISGVTLAGPRFAILDPRLKRSAKRRPATVLVALGGGRHAALGAAIAAEVRRLDPSLRIELAPGFAARGSTLAPSHASTLAPCIRLLPPTRLHRSLATCAVAIVGGGVTLYEACALGTPAVAMAVVPAQRPIVAGCAARGAVVNGRTAWRAADARRAARDAVRLVASGRRRMQLARTARRLVDGRGSRRVAEWLRAA